MPDFPDGWKLADPRPTTGSPHQDERTEQCPRCLAWLKPKKDGTVRVHSRELGDGTTTWCTGSNSEDERPFMVFTPAARWMVTGRRSAEVVARKITDAEILEPAE